MRIDTKRVMTQPLVGCVMGVLALGLVAETWLITSSGLGGVSVDVQLLGLAVALIVALHLSYQFPVHIRYTIKMEMGSVPLYLMAILLPPVLAAVTVGVGTVIAEWSVRKSRDSQPGDIATQAGRWMIIALAGSSVAHLVPASYSPLYIATLAATTVVLLAGDVVTAPFQIAPITGERPLRLFVECVKGVGLIEAGQYLLGFVGGLLAITDVWHTALLFLPVALVYKTSKRAKELHESTRLLLETMADQVDSKDTFTHHHSKRVTEWTKKMLHEMNMHGPEVELIITAARVHDIGKLSLSDAIIQKHEQLSEAEWAEMKKHPALGAAIVEKYPAFARGAAIVRSHHERFDGGGYPDGIGGADVPFGARLIAVADSFDAMTSDRPYRKGMSVERAAGILASGKGTQWDPDLVQVFLRVIAEELDRPVETVPAAVVSVPAV